MKADRILFLMVSVILIVSGCTANDKNADESLRLLEATIGSANQEQEVVIDHRFIAIDNVCAWPNLTVLEDGTIIATIFNQPSHARREGSVECWASTDGHFWEKRGTPAMHEPGTNRMNVAAGLAQNGDLMVIASGWSLKPAENPDDPLSLVAVLRPWVSRSSDGGRNWTVDKQAFPKAESGMTGFIPFGDIVPGADGALRVLAYAQSKDKATNKVSMFRSDNDGHSWQQMSVISDGHNAKAFSGGHNETAFFHLGSGQWIAAARRWKEGQALDLFRSDDDGQTWRLDQQLLTQERQHPAHFLQLANGKLLLTYGNRIPDQFGVAVKTSEDGGDTWSDELLLVDDLANGDVGYPASVQLPDGEILTAYYASQVASHQRYHMGVVLWNLQ